jgi:uncharacterized protein (TIGR02466 family)
MKVHEVFPTIVVQDEVEIHEEFKKNNLDELKNLWYKTNQKGDWVHETPENSGKCSLHLNEKYFSIFNSIKQSVIKYLDLLEVDHEKLNINFTKAWIGYHNKNIPQLNMHSHNGADISFCYYISSDETSDKFCVHTLDNMNEVAGALFETGKNFNMIKKYNRYNCNVYTITPQEGTVVLFPSRLQHSTLKKENNGDRYVIAGDIKLCLKPEYNLYHQSLPHPNLWLSF